MAGQANAAFKRTTISDDSAPVFDDLLKRDFTAQAPGTKLVGDITYLRTDQGWLYLATVIDLYTRMVVGWSMAPQMKTTLIIDAMTMARSHGYLQAGAIFHSDHGSQYTSKAFGAWCRGNRIRQSMGMTGQCWDNAVAESFFSTLKMSSTTTTVSKPTRPPERLSCAISRCSTTGGGLTRQTVDYRRRRP